MTMVTVARDVDMVTFEQRQEKMREAAVWFSGRSASQAVRRACAKVRGRRGPDVFKEPGVLGGHEGRGRYKVREEMKLGAGWVWSWMLLLILT